MIHSTFKMILGACLLGTSAMAQIEVLTPFELGSKAMAPSRSVSVFGNDRNVIATLDKDSGRFFQYDAVGNLERETWADPSKNVFNTKFYHYSDSSQLTRVDEIRENTTISTEFQYDLYDRLTQSGDRKFRYNAFNMMESFESPQHKAVYTYDPLTGLRSGKQVNGQTIRYVLDESQRVVQELDQENAVQSQIEWGEHGPQTYTYQGSVYSYELDPSGNVIALRNAEGQAVNQYTYDVWGTLETIEESIPNSIRYRGEYQDVESGFYYLRGRYYDPQTRRFTTQDPAEDGVNWNAYCGNNPLENVDPSGYVKVAMRSQSEMDAEVFYSGMDLFDLLKTSCPALAIAEFVVGWCVPGWGTAVSAAALVVTLEGTRVSDKVIEAGQKRMGLKIKFHLGSTYLASIEFVENSFVERLETTPFYVGRKNQ